MTRWFFDTEFNEDGETIELISIGMVSEDGRAYYAASSDFSLQLCNDWVKQNVLPKLPPMSFWLPRALIAREILDMVLSDGTKPEFWAYFADYDWVVLCQLYGRMIDLPKGFPFFCMDLKQHMKTMGVERSELPEQTNESEHDALADAKWVRKAWLWVEAHREYMVANK